MEIIKINTKENEPNYTDTKPYLIMLLMVNCFLQYLVHILRGIFTIISNDYIKDLQFSEAIKFDKYSYYCCKIFIFLLILFILNIYFIISFKLNTVRRI
jgi:hypothetical protein